MAESKQDMTMDAVIGLAIWLCRTRDCGLEKVHLGSQWRPFRCPLCPLSTGAIDALCDAQDRFAKEDEDDDRNAAEIDRVLAEQKAVRGEG